MAKKDKFLDQLYKVETPHVQYYTSDMKEVLLQSALWLKLKSNVTINVNPSFDGDLNDMSIDEFKKMIDEILK